MRTYMIEYRLYSSAEEREIIIKANSKAEAYDIATFKEIPAADGETPYSAWVAEEIYKNGKTHRFNTFEGKPY